jgi:CRP-like cAMP-binding protein
MPLFRYLSYKELVRVMNITDTVEFRAGESVIREGDPGETMYVVLEGEVRLHKGETTITSLGKGQHFGEMALVDRSPRSLSASSSVASRLIAIRRKDFYEIIKKEPTLSVKLLWSFVQVLAERLRKTTSELDLARNPRELVALEDVAAAHDDDVQTEVIGRAIPPTDGADAEAAARQRPAAIGKAMGAAAATSDTIPQMDAVDPDAAAAAPRGKTAAEIFDE